MNKGTNEATAELVIRVTPEELDLTAHRARTARMSMQVYLRVRVGLPLQPDSEYARRHLKYFDGFQRDAP